MIGRSDGGNAGGVLALNADMIAGGARPAWMGYLHTPDVDGMITAIEADGGTVHMPATELPVGRIAMPSDPQGPVFYIMTPIPPRSEERRVGKECASTLSTRWSPSHYTQQ